MLNGNITRGFLKNPFVEELRYKRDGQSQVSFQRDIHNEQQDDENYASKRTSVQCATVSHSDARIFRLGFLD
jgi:hypothetical protein